MDSAIIAALIGASATIVAAWITISRSRGLEPGHPPGGSPPEAGGQSGRTGRPRNPGQADALMPRFTVHGEVIRTIGDDLGIRVENEHDLRAFWLEHKINTDLDWFGKGPPVVSIGRKGDAARVKPGERASLTFVVAERSGGKRGIRTVGFEL